MKFNLKNRPKTCFEQDLCVADGDLAKWFEGFEKELREKWKKLDCESALELGQSMIIREILGES